MYPPGHNKICCCPNKTQDQTALRAFGPNGLSSAGNPGITFLAPSGWCSATTVAGMAVSSSPPAPGILPGQITSQLQIVATGACLYSNSSENGFVWGGSVTDGEFQCNSPSQPLGAAQNTFRSFFADDSTGTQFIRLVPDAGTSCGLAVVTNGQGQQQLAALSI